jgi:hypothetical protein
LFCLLILLRIPVGMGFSVLISIHQNMFKTLFDHPGKHFFLQEMIPEE